MTLEDWKTFLEIAELLVECAAIIGAGIWAIYTFGSLRQIARAKAEIAKTEAEITKTQAEITKTEAERRKADAEIERLSEQGRVGAVVQIQMTPSVEVIPGDPNKYLSVAAEITNTGTRNAEIEYPDTPFMAYAVRQKADGTFSYDRVATAHVVNAFVPSQRSKRMLVRAGGKQRLSFFVRLPGPGLYFLVVALPMSEVEQEVAKQFGFVSKGWWSAKQYFVVA